MQSAAILCRACGAPVEGAVGPVLRCGFCGSDTPVDAGLRQRLTRTLARTQRALDKARCLLRAQMEAQLLPAAAFRMKVYLFGSLALLLLGGPLVIGVGMAPFAFLDQVDRQTADLLALLGVAILVVGIVVITCAFPAGMYFAYREAKRMEERAARSAREAASYVEATEMVRCGQCGGHAQVVIIGPRVGATCPWCGSTLLVANIDAAKAAAQGILRAQQKTADAALRRAHLKSGLSPKNDKRLQIPGFVFDGGVHQSTFGDPPVWISFDLQESGFHSRIEAEHDTRLPGSVWFVRREGAPQLAQLLQSYGVRPPPSVSTEPNVDARFVVLADAGVDASSLARIPSVRQLLASLGVGESVRFDAAGASRWRCGSLFGAAAGDWYARAAQLVAVVRELG